MFVIGIVGIGVLVGVKVGSAVMVGDETAQLARRIGKTKML